MVMCQPAINRTCTGSSILCFGGYDGKAPGTLLIVACGYCYLILMRTSLNTPHLHNSVYWYYTSSKSFGYSADSSISQSSADIGSTNANLRLSWHLDQGFGGFRIGTLTYLNIDTVYYKIILKSDVATTTTTTTTTTSTTSSVWYTFSPKLIQNPSLTIQTPVSGNIFSFSNSVNFVIDMSFGTDVSAVLYIGEEESLKTWAITNYVVGEWLSPWIVTRSYRYPGDYNVTVLLSNSVSSFTLVQAIKVMSNVSGLIIELKNSPVVYLVHSIKSYGRAYFQFHYQGSTYAASHAKVSFTVNDNLGSTFGPFWLGMDFIQNIIRTPLYHDFDNIGNYTAVFNVVNDISSKTFVLQIIVVPSIYGVYIQTLPSIVIPGMTITMHAYIQQGYNVTLEWFIDGISQGIRPRMCK